MATRIRKGETFESFDELKEELEKYEKIELANFPISLSVLDKEQLDLKYKTVRFVCKLAGTHTKQGTARETKSYKQECDAYISVAQKTVNNKKVLEIVGLVSSHNHRRNKDLFNHMTKQRVQAINENRDKLETHFTTKSNVAALQTKLCADSGKILTRRDIYNAKVKWQKSRHNHENELVQIVESMCEIENTTTKIIANERDEVEFIFFQDSRMKKMFDSFPDVLFFDGTYNLNDRKMPVVVVMVVDGSGCSQIVGFIIVTSENATTFVRLLEIFKEENPKHKDIQVIISDKSFANRSAFNAVFPWVEHHLCVFHVFQIFEREITTAKRSITTEQKTRIHAILRAMVYAESETRYVELYDKLRRLNCQKVNEYFDANWHNIRNQWVGFYVNQYRHYENRTNNRLESFNQKIKLVVSKYSKLANFFDDLWTCTLSFNIERDHESADDVLRRPLTMPRLGHMSPYAEILTEFAYKKICQQALKSPNIVFSIINDVEAESLEYSSIIKTTNDSCTCAFFKSMDLPCAHMFAFLEANDINVYQPALCNKRFLVENNRFSSDFEYVLNAEQPSTSQMQLVRTQDAPKRLTQVQKFQKATNQLNAIAELLARKPQAEFEDHMKLVEQFRKIIESDQLPGTIT